LNEVVWFVNNMVAFLLILVGVIIYYIFKYDEIWPNGSDDTTKQEELLQLQGNEDKEGS